MNKNKIALLLGAAFLTINTGCTKSPEYEKSPQMPYVDDTYNQNLPQSFFDGIPFPASKEDAKSAGFTECVITEDKQYKCSTKRKVHFEGFEFESAYVLLNTNENRRDFQIIYDTKDFTSNFIATIKENARLNSKARSNDYSYHSVHLIADSVPKPTCEKSDARLLKNNTKRESYKDCSTNNHFLKKLEDTGWVVTCDESKPNKCVYYNKEGSYRIINHEYAGIVLERETDPKSQSMYKKSTAIHLEIDPLSPSEYGVSYSQAMKKIQLENQAKELEKQAIDKEQDFIKSLEK